MIKKGQVKWYRSASTIICICEVLGSAIADYLSKLYPGIYG